MIYNQEYWLDDTKKDSGKFVKECDRFYYFLPAIGRFYSIVESGENKGLIPFPKSKNNFTINQ